MRPRILSSLLVALSCAFVIASCNCGGGKDGGSSSSVGGAVKKVFTHNRQSEHKSLDPVKQFDAASAEVIMNVYDTLLEYHYLKRPYEMVPNLLTKMPELSPDGLTYTFELRSDVKFIDDPCFPGGKGRAIKSDDVIYSLKRFASTLNVKSYVLMQGSVEGMDSFRAATAKAGSDINKLEIVGLRKVDDQHFTMTLTQPNPLALYPLAATQTSIVAREAVEHYKDTFENHPVGTGPFKMKSLQRRGVMLLERNPNYHGVYPSEGAPGDAEAGLLAPAGKKLPFLDEIELPLIEEPQPAVLKFLANALDWVAIDRDNFVKIAFKDATGFHLQKDYVGKFQIYSEPMLSMEFLTFNMNDPLIGKNKALRQAIAYALDNKGFIDKLFNGRAIEVSGLVPPGIKGSQSDIKIDWYPNDIEAAKKKLAEAGYPGGKGLPELTIEYRSSTQRSRQDYEWNRNELAKIGITLKANFQTFTAFLQRMEAGNFQLSNQGWQADYPDAENFYQLLYSKNKPPGPNASAYNNPEYDKLFEQMRFMPNGPERFAVIEKMHAIIRDEVPVSVQFTQVACGLRQNWVKNFKRNIMLDMPFKYFDVDAQAKAAAAGAR